MIDLLIDWWNDGVVTLVIVSLTDWLIDWLTDWLTDWLADGMTEWLPWWLAHWLTGLAVCLVVCLTDWLAVWLAGWFKWLNLLTYLYTHSLTGWLIQECATRRRDRAEETKNKCIFMSCSYLYCSWNHHCGMITWSEKRRHLWVWNVFFVALVNISILATWQSSAYSGHALQTDFYYFRAHQLFS